MLKKILLGTVLIAIAGVLIAGGVIRTIDKTQQAEASSGLGTGTGLRIHADSYTTHQGQGNSGNNSGKHLYQANPDTVQSQAQAGNGYRGGNQQAGSYGQGSLKLAPASDLTQAEQDSLLFNREEEKFARDVYTALYDLWGHNTFNNIANSEQAHMDSLLEMIQRYDLIDPAANRAAGEFSDPQLQELYNTLAAQGSESLVSALRVGALIEDMDIYNLQNSIALTDNADLQQVYQNLVKGSENHLRAFVNGLNAQGEAYQPQYLSQEQVDAILSGSAGYGQGAGRQGSGNGQWGSNGQKNH